VLLAPGSYSVPSLNAYVEDSSNPCPRQADVDRVDVSDNISHSLELVQQLHDFVHLLEEVHLAASIVAWPPLDLTALLKLFHTVVYFVECSVDANGVRSKRRPKADPSKDQPGAFRVRCTQCSRTLPNGMQASRMSLLAAAHLMILLTMSCLYLIVSTLDLKLQRQWAAATFQTIPRRIIRLESLDVDGNVDELVQNSKR
jgi:hypothetical protein